ncbi:transmembrane protein 272-like [Haliotis rubra]|uniref:transmembrane protein 272-like n=1 Tax=Haliotis rubra TaxID=36100 RepID=UPI001EE5A6AA|nr:transmembrane protein 272-like [Haliotis rubra]
MASIIKTFNAVSERSGKTGTLISTAVGLAVPIAMIAMGLIHREDCPAQKYIAIYLIVAGAFAAIMSVLRLAVKMWCSDSDGNVPLPFSIANGVIAIFLLAWFIAGNVWVYGLYGKYNQTDITADNYCKHDFYLFAFWLITAGYILLGACILLGCFVACCCRN